MKQMSDRPAAMIGLQITPPRAISYFTQLHRVKYKRIQLKYTRRLPVQIRQLAETLNLPSISGVKAYLIKKQTDSPA